jgi:hypothetical protein
MPQSYPRSLPGPAAGTGWGLPGIAVVQRCSASRVRFESRPLLGPRDDRVWFPRRAEGVPLVRGDDLGSGVQTTAEGQNRGFCSTRAIWCEVPAVKVGENLERATASATKTATGETATTAKASPSTPT